MVKYDYIIIRRNIYEDKTIFKHITVNVDGMFNFWWTISIGS